MNDTQKIIGIIVENIEKAGFTEKECLKACGIGSNFFTDVRSGKSKFPPYDKIVKLSQYLKIDLDYLFLNKKEKKHTSFTNAEVNLIDKFRILNDVDQKRILKKIDTFLEDYPEDESKTEVSRKGA